MSLKLCGPRQLSHLDFNVSPEWVSCLYTNADRHLADRNSELTSLSGALPLDPS